MFSNRLEECDLLEWNFHQRVGLKKFISFQCSVLGKKKRLAIGCAAKCSTVREFSLLPKFYVVCYMILVKESIKQITLPDPLSNICLGLQ